MSGGGPDGEEALDLSFCPRLIVSQSVHCETGFVIRVTPAEGF